jgi:hypothetical protein
MKTFKYYKITMLITAIFLTYSCKRHSSVYGFDTTCCKLVKDINAETRFAQLSCDNWDVQIDYGFGVYSYLTSHSAEDYVKKEKWKFNAMPNLSRYGLNIFNLKTVVDSIKILSIDSSLKAILSYKDQIYEHEITIPEELIDLVEIKESKGHLLKHLIYNEKTMKSFRFFLVDNSNVSLGTPKAIKVSLESHQPMSLQQATKLFNNVSFP